MRKGIVLTVDALMAVLFMGVFLMLISFELSIPAETPYLFKTSADFLTVLDMSSTVKNMSTQSEAQAKVTLDYYLSTLPGNIGANVTVRTYEYNGATFDIIRTISSVKGSKEYGDVVTIRRIFANPVEEDEEFGLMTMEMWYE